MDSYLGLRFQIAVQQEDELPEILSRWPVLGTLIEPGADGMLSVVVFVHVRDDSSLPKIAAALESSGAAGMEIERVPARDWLARYRDQAIAFPIGRRWWIDPRPDSPVAAPPPRQRLVIEPGMAFGSGSHESTQLILDVLEKWTVVGVDVLDIGTGSGILALAAEASGARRVIGLDTDAMAIRVARNVLVQQEWKPDIQLILGPLSCLASTSFDYVLCNMISANFLPLLDDIHTLLGESGRAVFSGMLVAEELMAEDALTDVGLVVEEKTVRGEWLCLTAVRAR